MPSQANPACFIQATAIEEALEYIKAAIEILAEAGASAAVDALKDDLDMMSLTRKALLGQVKLFKGRYMIAVYDHSDLLRAVYDNPDDMSDRLGRPMAAKASKCLKSGGCIGIHIGSEPMKMVLVDVTG